MCDSGVTVFSSTQIPGFPRSRTRPVSGSRCVQSLTSTSTLPLPLPSSRDTLSDLDRERRPSTLLLDRKWSVEYFPQDLPFSEGSGDVGDVTQDPSLPSALRGPEVPPRTRSQESRRFSPKFNKVSHRHCYFPYYVSLGGQVTDLVVSTSYLGTSSLFFPPTSVGPVSFPGLRRSDGQMGYDPPTVSPCERSVMSSR